MKEEEKKKRIYLSLESQKEIIRSFFNLWKGKEFGRTDLKVYLIENYEWFEKSGPSIQSSRLENLILIMKDMYGRGLERVRGGQPGEPVKWLLPLIAGEVKSESEESEVKEITLKPKEKTKKSRSNIARINAFYNIIKMASKPLGGITKKDLAAMMGYKNATMSQQGIDSINSLFDAETGYSPIEVDKSHKFINLDIICIKGETETEKGDLANLILAELLEKLSNVEPEEPSLEYERIVKAIIKSDYNVLKMFLGKPRLEYSKGDAFTFRNNVIKGCNITVSGNRNSMEHIVNSFVEYIKTRYELELEMYVKPYSYIQLQSSQDELKDVLKRIEDIYAEYFCEDIVPHELTILAEEIEKESSQDEIESEISVGISTFVEKVVFKEQSGKMFLSEMWEKLDKYHFTPGWDIFNMLTRCERFTTAYGTRPDGVGESCIIYTAPAKKEEEPTIPKPQELLKENKKIINFSFAERTDIKYFCDYGNNILKFYEIGVDRGYVSCAVEVNLDDKKSILSYLKLHYAALRSKKIIEVFSNSESFAKELEQNLFE